MRGYAGREAPPKERLTVGPGQVTLTSAIEQMKIAQAFAVARGTDQKFLRVDPSRYGVNFVTYGPDGAITSLAQVDQVEDKIAELQANNMPLIYPADPFIAVPTVLLVQYPVLIILAFADHLAYRLVFKPGAAGAPVRVGQVGTGAGVVLTLGSDQFKIVNPTEEQ